MRVAEQRLELGFLASHGGTNMQAIIDACKEGRLQAELRVVISNKLGWKRVPLHGTETTFEPGVWIDLQHDAQQCISYDGILDCWEQGCELLGDYRPALVSVHDPDVYLATAATPANRRQKMEDIRQAYKALLELKEQGEVRGIGVGARDWTIIRELYDEVELDWVMVANSFTIMRHPESLIDFITVLAKDGVGIINSAVFHGGFLTGGAFFDYRQLDEGNPEDRVIFDWRRCFYDLCDHYDVTPAIACVQFGLSLPGIHGIALNTSNPERVKSNVASVSAQVPTEFWQAMRSKSLIAPDYPYVSGDGPAV